MLVVDSPPPSQQFLIYTASRTHLASPSHPRLVFADEMYERNTAGEMSVRWKVLIVPTGSTVVGKTQSFPVPEMHVEQTLICPVEADAPLCKGQKSVVVTHIWLEGKDATIETIGPADIGNSCK